MTTVSTVNHVYISVNQPVLKLTERTTQVGVSLMVCTFSHEWSVPPIAYKLHSLYDLREIALVKTAHMTPKNLGFGSPRF